MARLCLDGLRLGESCATDIEYGRSPPPPGGIYSQRGTLQRLLSRRAGAGACGPTCKILIPQALQHRSEGPSGWMRLIPDLLEVSKRGAENRPVPYGRRVPQLYFAGKSVETMSRLVI